MRKRTGMFLAPLVIASLALIVVSGGAVSAAGTPPGGVVHIYEADTSFAGSLGTVVLTGAVTDHGKDHQGVPPDGFNRLVLAKGSLEINVNDLGNKVASFPVDPNTCSFDGTATAPTPIVEGSGTKAYRGITGTIESTATAAGILPRLKNGKCDTNPLHVKGVLLVTGSGTVSFK